MSRLSTIMLAGVLALPLHAQITYVDAVAGAAGNTFATGSTPDDTNWNSATSSNQDLWQERTGFGTNGNIFQAWFPNGVPEITTQITGLPDGIYNLYVFFWDASGANTWGIDAGLTSGSLTRYSFDGAGITDQTVTASTLDFVNDPMFTEVDRVLYGVNLGQATVTGGSAIDVFVDGTVPGFANRVWYDGIGYELVPEITSPALNGFTYDPSTGDSQVSIEGSPNTAYILVEAQDLDFDTPDQSPVPLTSATVGTLAANQVITDGNGNATVQFNLGTTKPATFIRAEGAPPLLEENSDAAAALPAG